MLKEITAIRQISGEPYRRWFEDRDFDLIVWEDARGEVVGFELCYDKRTVPYAVRWEMPTFFRHYRMDEGESRPGKSKASPVLESASGFMPDRVATLFQLECHHLDRRIAGLVSTKLLQFQMHREKWLDIQVADAPKIAPRVPLASVA